MMRPKTIFVPKDFLKTVSTELRDDVAMTRTDPPSLAMLAAAVVNMMKRALCEIE